MTTHRTVHNVLATRPVAVLRGLPGIGKTTLAEQYAGRFGGGVIRTGPFGALAPDDFLPCFHLALAEAAAARLGTDVSGLPLDRLRALLADRIGDRVLVLVDDVPAGLPPAVLDRLLLPAAPARTLVTSRSTQWPWAASTVDLPGLTPDEGLRLFAAIRAPENDDERKAVRQFVVRCGGHPMTLRATAFALRHHSGPLTGEVLAALPDTAPQAVRDVLRELGPLARDLLRLGATLAPAPIPPEVARAALGSPAAPGFAAAVEELVTRGFATLVDGGLRLQALAVEVAHSAFGGLPDQAAEAVLDSGLLHHARALADHAPALRVPLLRAVAAAHEALGDPATAGEVHAAILSTGEATPADLTAAARVEIACGLHAEAAGHARAAQALAVDEDERYAAGLTAAQALDCQGDYAEADRTFWQAAELPAAGEARYQAAVATARALRLRGRPRDAVALLEPELRDAPGPFRDELNLEYARSLLLTGQPGRAQDVAEEVVASHHTAGRERHPRCTEAELVHADAVLALELACRQRSPAELRALAENFARQHGSEHPLTLTASVCADRALLALGQPQRALRVLAATERVVRRVLGDDHQLGYRISHGRGLALAQLREFGRQADLLEGILGPQIRLLGRTHPETLESRLDLGIALALSGCRRARKLVDEAARDAVGTGLSAKARAARQIVRLVWPGG